jgi:hypothetical protein
MMQKDEQKHEDPAPIEPGHVMSKKKYRELLEGQQK